MKKVLLSLAVVGFFAFTSCKNETATVAVETDVENVEGENVADAQKELNEEVKEAQDALNEANLKLEEARTNGDATMIEAGEASVKDLQARLDEIQRKAGEAIQAVDGAMDGADKVLDNTTDAAEKQLDNLEEAADKVKDAAK